MLACHRRANLRYGLKSCQCVRHSSSEPYRSMPTISSGYRRARRRYSGISRTRVQWQPRWMFPFKSNDMRGVFPTENKFQLSWQRTANIGERLFMAGGVAWDLGGERSSRWIQHRWSLPGIGLHALVTGHREGANAFNHHLLTSHTDESCEISDSRSLTTDAFRWAWDVSVTILKTSGRNKISV